MEIKANVESGTRPAVRGGVDDVLREPVEANASWDPVHFEKALGSNSITVIPGPTFFS